MKSNPSLLPRSQFSEQEKFRVRPSWTGAGSFRNWVMCQWCNSIQAVILVPKQLTRKIGLPQNTSKGYLFPILWRYTNRPMACDNVIWHIYLWKIFWQKYDIGRKVKLFRNAISFPRNIISFPLNNNSFPRNNNWRELNYNPTERNSISREQNNNFQYFFPPNVPLGLP